MLRDTYEWRRSKARAQSGERKPGFGEGTNFPDAGNMILAALPSKEVAQVRQSLELVRLNAGEIILEVNAPIRSVYFPTSGMVSFVAVMRDGATAEVGITGREGFFGTGAVLGARDALFRALVQCAGGPSHRSRATSPNFAANSATQTDA
jgi:CRP-like cAMP-binding protein